MNEILEFALLMWYGFVIIICCMIWGSRVQVEGDEIFFENGKIKRVINHPKENENE